MSALVIGKRPCVPACRSSQVIAPLRTRQAAQALRFTRVSERATRSVHCRVEAPDLTKDDMGDLAEKIQEVGKSVDEGLQGASVSLVGMMGSGKSTTGQMIANALRYCYFDTDAVIEQAAGGATIPEIFADAGEDGFREIETKVLRELAAYKNCVIATGGGAVLRPANWASMNSSVVVFLDGEPELLARRICSREGTASRPLLSEEPAEGEDVEAATAAKLRDLLAERRKFYASADCTVSLKGKGELGASASQMALRVLISIDQKIKASTAEREARKNFVIKDEGLIPIGEKVADAVEKPAN